MHTNSGASLARVASVRYFIFLYLKKIIMDMKNYIYAYDPQYLNPNDVPGS